MRAVPLDLELLVSWDPSPPPEGKWGQVSELGAGSLQDAGAPGASASQLLPPSLPQFQTLEGSPAALMHPPSCRGPPWKTCCAHTPPSPVRMMPPRAV